MLIIYNLTLLGKVTMAYRLVVSRQADAGARSDLYLRFPVSAQDKALAKTGFTGGFDLIIED